MSIYTYSNIPIKTSHSTEEYNGAKNFVSSQVLKWCQILGRLTRTVSVCVCVCGNETSVP